VRTVTISKSDWMALKRAVRNAARSMRAVVCFNGRACGPRVPSTLKQKLVVHLLLGAAHGVHASAVRIDERALSITLPAGRITVPFDAVRFVKMDEIFIWQAPNWLAELDAAYWDGIVAKNVEAKKASSPVRIRRKQPSGTRRQRR
jgi:hypothetical protein